uniref:Uncharacterized protein n=1 Tax=Anguilla anguilla TaxID=7936 RepID=A0A0E9PZF3_ANGAN
MKFCTHMPLLMRNKWTHHFRLLGFSAILNFMQNYKRSNSS